MIEESILPTSFECSTYDCWRTGGDDGTVFSITGHNEQNRKMNTWKYKYGLIILN